MSDQEWVPDDALESIKLEGSLHPSETPEDMADRIFRESLPVAASVIVSLTLKGTTERIRLDAAKYVIERVLGKIGDSKPAEMTEAPWEGLYKEVTREVTAEAKP